MNTNPLQSARTIVMKAAAGLVHRSIISTEVADLALPHRLGVKNYRHLQRLLNRADENQLELANKLKRALDVLDVACRAPTPLMPSPVRAQIRWVSPDGTIGASPTATDLLEYANERLAEPSEEACCRSDIRLAGFERLLRLLGGLSQHH